MKKAWNKERRDTLEKKSWENILKDLSWENNEALIYGKSNLLMRYDENIYAYERVLENDTFIVMCNLSDNEALYYQNEINLNYDNLIMSTQNVDYHENTTKISLKPWESRMYKVESKKREQQKMIDGDLYVAFGDAGMETFEERQYAKEILFDYNNLRPSQMDERNEMLRKLLGSVDKNFFIEPPFRCDYGYNIFWGEGSYANYNLTVLDCAPVKIGKNVLIGPNVNIFTAGHPIDPKIRTSGLEFAMPITIDDNVWIGGGSTINPGVNIGENTVIASGSVVTKDIPSNVVAGGNPCKIIREINEEDKKRYFKGKYL